MRIWWLAGATVVCGMGGFAWWYWERTLELRRPETLALRLEISDSGMRVAAPALYLVADLGEFDDELIAYLMTGYQLHERNLLDRFDGDVPTAVAAYNGGPGNPNMQ